MDFGLLNRANGGKVGGGSSSKMYFVIGGCGNLGGQIISTLLLQEGTTAIQPSQIICIDVCKFKGKEHGVQSVILDISSPDATEKLEQILVSAKNDTCASELVVFHTASVIDIRPIPSPRMRQVNVTGTHRVLEACQRVAASNDEDDDDDNGKTSLVLVYTSSIECVSGRLANGQVQTLNGVNEDASYPTSFFLPYAQSKAEAERMVLEANGSTNKNLITVSIRSGFIVGPDCIGVKIGILRALRRNLSSPVYVTAKLPGQMSCIHPTNCAIAHLLAADRAKHVAGQAFFAMDFIANVIEISQHAYEGSPIKVLCLPLWLVLALGWVIDCLERFLHWFYRTFLGRTRVTSDEVVDVEAIRLGCCDVRVSNKRAVERLGYGTDNRYPALISRDECLKQTKDWAHDFIHKTMMQMKETSQRKKRN